MLELTGWDISFFRPVKISSYGLTVHNVQNFNMSAWRSERLCQAVTGISNLQREKRRLEILIMEKREILIPDPLMGES